MRKGATVLVIPVLLKSAAGSRFLSHHACMHAQCDRRCGACCNLLQQHVNIPVAFVVASLDCSAIVSSTRQLRSFVQKLSSSTTEIIQMVFGGQDAWRKHPLLAGNWKKPFPGLGMAVGLFAFYCVGEYIWTKAMASPPSHLPSKPKITFKLAGDMGDTMPEAKVKGGGHH